MVHLSHENSPLPQPPAPLPVPPPPPSPPWQLWTLRLLLVAAALTAWFVTQHLIGARLYTGTIGDALLDALTPLHTFLMQHAPARNTLLITSSAGIDSLAIFLLARSVFGPTLRPFVAILLLFALRQTFQALCVLPAPPEMIWPKEGPGFPSLLVTYGVSNDLFFSGHTALAVLGAVELARYKRALLPLGIALALFEIITVLALRAHWTMDVYAGAISALLVAILAQHLTPPLDRTLARLTTNRQSAIGNRQ